ncbi:MAG: tetratricopeptide repeat protein [Clostridiales bacterium]|jgi:tetratricopeptide (TPR) repeat protein|nr:tetratricopeptide repeat protein [Clostridiales bacterium]
MTENVHQTAMDFYAGEVKKNRNKEKVAPLYAWTILIVTALVVSSIGWGIGKLFFWERFNADPFYMQQFEALKQRVTADPDNVENLVALGWAYFQMGDYNQALTNYDKAAQLDEKHFPAYYNRGLTYLQVEKYELAIRSFQHATTLSPRDYATRMNLGIAFYKNGQLEKAAESLEIAYSLRPGAIEILLSLGEVYEAQGKNNEALIRYQAALGFDPNNEAVKDAISRLRATN